VAEYWDDPDDDEYPGEFYGDDGQGDDGQGDDGQGDDGLEDEDLDSESLPCPACGQDVYEDSEQCPACGNYITHSHGIAPVWRWTAVALLVFIALIMWSCVRQVP
jgi:hypothetical protein